MITQADHIRKVVQIDQSTLVGRLQLDVSDSAKLIMVEQRCHNDGGIILIFEEPVDTKPIYFVDAQKQA